MSSHGAMRDVAAKEYKPAKKVLEGIMLKKADGGVIAEHHFTDYAHKPEPHVFASGEGAKLHAHLSEHLGIGGKEDE